MILKITFFLAGLSFMAFSGCHRATNPDDFDAMDGNAGFVASEVSAMDDAAFDFDSIGAPKAASGAAAAGLDSVTIRWAYDSTRKAWTRAAHAYYTRGERVRYDTVWFFGTGGDTLEQRPTLALVDSVYHVRSVTCTWNGNAVNNRLEMRTKVTKTALDTSARKNGTIKGAYNGNDFSTCTVTDVVRKRVNGIWQFPESGGIYIDRILRTIDIVFIGNGQAAVTVIRKRDNKRVEFVVTVSTGEES